MSTAWSGTPSSAPSQALLLPGPVESSNRWEGENVITGVFGDDARSSIDHRISSYSSDDSWISLYPSCIWFSRGVLPRDSNEV